MTTNDFDFDSIRFEQNNWVSTEIQYCGPGSVDFTNPVGTVSGPFVARFDDRGLRLIETEYELMSVDPDYEGNPLAFLFGSKAEDNEKLKSWAIGGTENPAHQLRVEVNGGTLTSEGVLRLRGFESKNSKQILRFDAPICRFDARSSKPAKYYAMPVANFVSAFHQSIQGQHPIRINPTPEVPSNLPQHIANLAQMKANERNHVVGFHFEGSVIFIEPLSDYDKRVDELMHGLQRCTTSVLVGEIGSREVGSFQKMMEWLPVRLLRLLSFATGHEVGVPWIELRDEDGELVSRVHTNFGVPSFDSGDPIFSNVDRGSESGIGTLSEQFLNLRDEQQALLSVVMGHTRMGSLGLLKIHDTLDHLIRALESLCKYHKVDAEVLDAGLDPKVRANLHLILVDSRQKLNILAKECANAGDHKAALNLERIVGRVASAAQKEKDFGISISSLLQHYGLLDQQVMDAFYLRFPRKDGRSWGGVLSYYRGAVIHEGVFDFDKHHDVEDVVGICVHLRDILIRIVLTTCGYEGTYQPAGSVFSRPSKTDWVNIKTDVKQLGYRHS